MTECVDAVFHPGCVCVALSLFGLVCLVVPGLLPLSRLLTLLACFLVSLFCLRLPPSLISASYELLSRAICRWLCRCHLPPPRIIHLPSFVAVMALLVHPPLGVNRRRKTVMERDENRAAASSLWPTFQYVCLGVCCIRCKHGTKRPFFCVSFPRCLGRQRWGHRGR